MDFDQVLALVPEPAEVSIEARTGAGAYGDVYAAATTVRCVVLAKRRLVRAPDGSQVVSESTVLAPLETTVPPRSRITLPDGTQTLVIGVTRHNGHGLPVPEHAEITCE